MILVVALAVLGVLGARPRSTPHHERRAAEVVVARELAIDPVTSAESKAAAAPRTVPVMVPKSPAELPDFRSAVARQLESLPICRRPGGPEGAGLAEVIYLPNGAARVALSPNFANSSAGACVARRLANAATPFEGEPVSLKVRFEL